MAKLDDVRLQNELVSAVTSGDKLAVAARKIGLSRQAVTAYLKTHAELAEAVAVARRRSAIAAHHGPRIPPKVTRTATAEVMLDGDPGEHDCRDPDAFLELVSRHANDGDSRGCSKALEILDRWHNAAHYLAIQAQAKRDAAQLELDSSQSAKPVIIEVPIVDQSTEVP